MITLSKRLLTIGEMVPKSEVHADVGTDHGFLPVWLLQQEKTHRVLASDINDGPLRKAKETAENYGLSDSIKTVLADGLQYPDADLAQVVTICGMGGETMISILSAAPWTAEGRQLVLQPQSKLFELESWLQKNGYSETDAKLCLDSGKLYLILAVYGGGNWERSCEQWLLFHRDPLFSEYLRREHQKTERALQGLYSADCRRSAVIRTMEARLQAINAMEKEIQTW